MSPQTTATSRIPTQLAWPPSAPGKNRLQAVIDMLNAIWGQLAAKINAAPTSSGGQALESVTVTTSPFTYTNLDGFDEAVVVSGGTVSEIDLVRAGASTNLGITSGFVHLLPQDGLTITFSSTPGAMKVPL